jgi:hypothetical protein
MPHVGFAGDSAIAPFRPLPPGSAGPMFGKLDSFIDSFYWQLK